MSETSRSRRHFLANSSPVRGGLRADSRELGRIREEFAERSANVRRTRANVGGVREIKKLANGWRTRAEFARIRASSPAFARVRGERSFARYSAGRAVGKTRLTMK